MSEETGGFAIVNQNDLERGLRPDRPGEQQLLPARVLRLQPGPRRPVPERAGSRVAPGRDRCARGRLPRSRKRPAPPAREQPGRGADAPGGARRARQPDSHAGHRPHGVRGAVRRDRAQGVGRAGDRSRSRRADVRPEGRHVQRGSRNPPARDRRGAARCRAAAATWCRCGCARRSYAAVTEKRPADHPPPRAAAGALSDSRRRARDEQRQARDDPAGSRRAGLLEGAAADERDHAHVGIRGAHPDGEPRPRVQGRAARPRRRRFASFPPSDTLSLFAEVYDNQTRAPHRVAISHDRGRRRRPRGVHHRGRAQQRGSAGEEGRLRLHGEDSRWRSWRAGRYVLRVEARTLLTNGGTAARELEFRVR